MPSETFSTHLLHVAAALAATPEMLADRRDVSAVTVDDTKTKDLDDAIRLWETPTGYLIEVSIASVDEYIKAHSELDWEAYFRCFTIYRPNGDIPMLPTSLSEGLLSLHPHQPKLTKTISIELDHSFNITSTKIEKTTLVSERRYSYDEATTEIRTQGSEMSKWYFVANNLLKKRNGQFDEKTGLYIAEDGATIALDPKKAHGQVLIQEFMILANHAVALEADRMGIGFLFRGQQQLKSKTESALPAKYSTTAQIHDSLKLQPYCHFTSPIRRYADLICHRMISAELDGLLPPYTREQLEEIAAYINQLFIADSKNRRTNKRDAHFNAMSEHILYGTEETLRLADTKLFSSIVNASLKYDIPTDPLLRVAEERIAEIRPSVMCKILLNPDHTWDKLREKTFSMMLERRGLASEIMSVANQLQPAPFSEQSIQFTKIGSKTFLCRALVTIDGVKYSTTCHTQGERAIASDAASIQFWQEFLDGKLVRNKDFTDHPPSAPKRKSERLQMSPEPESHMSATLPSSEKLWVLSTARPNNLGKANGPS